MAARYGSSWAHDSCDRWVANDRKDSAWRHDLWRCPCTLAQALSDFGRYQPDESCNVYHQTSNQCDRHRGAIHCVLSVWAKYVYISPDSKVHGANMGPTWVLSAPDGPHVGPMNLTLWVCICLCAWASSMNRSREVPETQDPYGNISQPLFNLTRISSTASQM